MQPNTIRHHRTKHTAPPPNSQTAAYIYKHAGSMASQGVAWRHAVTEPGYKACSNLTNKALYVKGSKTQAAANINPLVSIPNAVKTLTMGDNIYDEKIDKIDTVFSIIDIGTLGADGILFQAKMLKKPLIPLSEVGVELIKANNTVIKAGNLTLETTKTLTGK